jgi:hypothetical protein
LLGRWPEIDEDDLDAIEQRHAREHVRSPTFAGLLFDPSARFPTMAAMARLRAAPAGFSGSP